MVLNNDINVREIYKVVLNKVIFIYSEYYQLQ